MNILHIIGNGFDLNQGLPTSYAHFYEFYFQLAPKEGDTDAINKFRELLAQKLYDKRTDRWADLEKTLGEVAADFESGDEYTEAYLDIYIHLMEYLQETYKHSELVKFETPEKTLYRDLATPWKHLTPRDQTAMEYHLSPSTNDVHVNIINFNYTETLQRISELPEKVGKSLGRYDNRNTVYDGCLHIHHKLKNRDVILGVDNVSQIANEKFRNDERIQNYLVKPQTNSGFGNLEDRRCIELIKRAYVISIYGMSIGETDTTWWKEIGKRFKAEPGVRILYFPYVKDIDTELPIKLPLKRVQSVRELSAQLGLSYQEAKDRILVNFCNIPGERNIFSNTKHKDTRDNFENTMAVFQEKGIIRKPQTKALTTPFHLDLVPPLPEQEPLFEARIYRKKLLNIEKTVIGNGDI